MKRLQQILIVGVGSIGERHLRCFGATGRATLALCEVNPTLRATVAERYAVATVYDRLEDALAARPDGVVIATPANLHVPMMAACVAADIPFLVEKPLSTTPDGVDAILERVRERSLVTMVAYVVRCNPALAAMRQAIAAGRIGRPLQVVATCGQHFPTYRPGYREIYYRDRATGGGAVQDALTHILDAGQWLAGPIDRLVADCDHLALEGVEVEDTAHVLTRQGAVLGCYSLNQHQAPNEVTITVIGDRGTARFEGHNMRWRAMAGPGGDWLDEAFPTVERDTLFVTQANAFLDAVEGKGAATCTLAEAAHTLKVHTAIFDSMASQQWCSVLR